MVWGFTLLNKNINPEKISDMCWPDLTPFKGVCLDS